MREATYPPAAVNVLDVSSESMAAFQVFMYGRFWVFTEAELRTHARAFLNPADADIEVRCAEQDVVERIRSIALRNIEHAPQ